jgi:hypothetical protein
MDPKTFNKRLLELYGSSLDGKPNFRLVWSEGLTEKRTGTFEKITPGGVWLGRESNVTLELRKYDYLKDRWILEVYSPEQSSLNREIAKGDNYEPLFVFQNNKREYLEPAWFAIEYIVRRYQDVRSGNFEKRNEKMDLAEQERLEEKEAQAYLDYLESESSDLSNKFRYQEAVIIHKDEN